MTWHASKPEQAPPRGVNRQTRRLTQFYPCHTGRWPWAWPIYLVRCGFHLTPDRRDHKLCPSPPPRSFAGMPCSDHPGSLADRISRFRGFRIPVDLRHASQAPHDAQWCSLRSGPTDVPGLYRFQFRIGGEDIQGRVKTSLLGMAIKRAQLAIDRRLRVQRAKSTSSRPRRMMHGDVAFVIKPADVPGLYRFQFRIGRKDIQGRVQTSLPAMAIKRARSAIDRRLRVQVSTPTTRCSSPPFPSPRS